MKKVWFLILLGFIFACSSVKAETKDNLTDQGEIQCMIVVKRFKATEEVYEPIGYTEVVVVGSKEELPSPADYLVLGSMEIETTKECRLDEVLNAIKTGAGGFGANYVLPWNVENQSSGALEKKIDKWVSEKSINTYILLRRKKLSI